MNRLLTATCTAATGLVMLLGSGPALAASSGSGGVNSYFNNCSEARAAGQGNIPETQATYREELDQDRDGVACETNEGVASSSGSTSGSGSLSTGASGSVSGGGSGTIRINTGTGGQADSGSAVSTVAPAVVGGLGVLVLGGSAIALRRRNGVATGR
jgi:hypothetical protein